MRQVILLAAVLCVLTPAASEAATCTISGTGVAFGTYIPSTASPTNSTGTVTVTCSAFLETVNYSIALNAGANSGGSFSNRRMLGGTAFLTYQLYTNAARTTIWGDGTGGTVTVSDSYSCLLGCSNQSRNYTVFGRVPALQWPRPGFYSDTIVATVTFN